MSPSVYVLPFLAFVAASPAAAQSSPVAASKGAYAAIAADCLICHTMPGGAPFAGGYRMATPGGVLYSTNITPDAKTGIGAYTFEQFDKAVRRGVRKDGARLYPAMPYPSYAHLSEDDSRALYDYFIKEVKPVAQSATPSEIRGLYAMRWGLALWNLIGDGAPFSANQKNDAVWNRGAYLVQGPGHCGACHTPRGFAFQEKGLDERSSSYLSGGVLDNWSAPNLRGDLNTGLGRWSEAEIAEYLKQGFNQHSAAFGAMRDVVVASTSKLTDEDRTAIARYLKSLSPSMDRGAPAWVYDASTTEDLTARRFQQPGAATFARQCASCHGADGKGGGGLPPLAGNPAVQDPNPSSLINIVVNGAQPLADSEAGEFDWMPQFRSYLGDAEIADVVSFIRSGWGNRASPATAAQVNTIRQATAGEMRTDLQHMR